MEDNQELVVQSDSESSSSSSSYHSERLRCFTKHGMVKLDEDRDKEHNVMKKAFLGSLGPFVHHAKVVAIHKNLHSGLIGQAKVEAFRIYSDAVAKKCGGDANIRFAWYGASRDEISKILCHGFCCNNYKPHKINGHHYGVGVHLSPANLSTNSLMSTMEDENGMRHMLLCRVILGNMEVVQPGSQQFQPTQEYFDSGVDNLLSPKTYVVWNSYMNSHIIPKYIISFKLSKGTGRSQNFPRSPYMNISSLLRVLSKYLHPSKIALISKYHNDFLVNRITRDQLIRRLRQIAGDKLLKYVIKQATNQK